MKTGAEATLAPVGSLYFDPANPRFMGGGAEPTQREILRTLWRDFAVDEIALSVAASGFYQYEPLIVVTESGRLVVVEGNRRLAAVKLLRDPALRRDVGATDLPVVSKSRKASLDFLPVIETTRAATWQYVGFKHVNGPQAWQSYSKAQYIAWVHNQLDVSLDDIAEQIGDQHETVQRLYRALMALEQAAKAGVYYTDDRYKKHLSFSHLYTGLDYSGIQRFAGISQARSLTKSPITPTKIKQFGQLCEWLYGSKSKHKPPLIKSQNPDLRVLDEVLQSKDGTAALRRGLPLKVAQDISKGDELILREALLGAKQALQEAKGKLVTGYQGERDVLNIAEDVRNLSQSVLDEMLAKQAAQSLRRPRTARTSVAARR